MTTMHIRTRRIESHLVYRDDRSRAPDGRTSGRWIYEGSDDGVTWLEISEQEFSEAQVQMEALARANEAIGAGLKMAFDADAAKRWVQRNIDDATPEGETPPKVQSVRLDRGQLIVTFEAKMPQHFEINFTVDDGAKPSDAG